MSDAVTCSDAAAVDGVLTAVSPLQAGVARLRRREALFRYNAPLRSRPDDQVRVDGLCEAQRVYRVVNDHPGWPLSGKVATCAMPAAECDGVHFDIVHQCSWM